MPIPRGLPSWLFTPCNPTVRTRHILQAANYANTLCLLGLDHVVEKGVWIQGENGEMIYLQGKNHNGIVYVTYPE